MPCRQILAASRRRAQATALGTAAATMVIAAGSAATGATSAPWWVVPALAAGLWVTSPLLRRRVLDPAPLHPARPVTTLALCALVPPVIAVWDLMQQPHGSVRGLTLAAAMVIYPMVIVWLYTSVEHLEISAMELHDLSSRDHLTGLYNRRTGEDHLAAVMRSPDGLPLSVALIDLDHFKAYNDTYGHTAGDELLVAAAAAWTARLGSHDLLTRHGGEEFLIISRRPAEEIEALAHRLRAYTPHHQTLSAGIAEWDSTESRAGLLARADRALYTAKRTGRNRCLIAH